MANELIHASAGTTLTQAEFEAVGLHICNSQATGDLIYASSAAQLSRLGIGSSGQIVQVVSGIPSWQNTINKNIVINGDFRVAQRGTSFTSATTPANSDDTYLLDRWILLSDGNDIVDVSQETSTTIANPAYNIKLDVETANKKFGILTILEQKDSRRFINQTVTLSFKAKITGTTINAIRAAVLSWNSTADTVTSDVVDVWGDAGTNPTVVANWTLENTPAALTAPTTSWASYSITGIAIDTASATNIAVFIWTDDVTMNVGDFLHIADIQLEIGSVATPFEFRPFEQELALCKRYYEQKSSTTYMPLGVGWAEDATNAYAIVPYYPKRVLATATVSAVDDFLFQCTSGAIASTNIAITLLSTESCKVQIIVAAGLTAREGGHMLTDNSGTSWMAFAAEL